MKNILSTILALALCSTLTAQDFSEKIVKELTFEKRGTNNTLMIFNINGHIKVEAYDGEKILIEVQKKINGKTQARVDKGKEEIQLGVMDRADTILLYVNGVCSEFGKVKENHNWQTKYKGYGYNWNRCGRGRDNDCDKEYDYTMNFTIKVPANISVFASTVNDGDVSITGVRGYVLADNVNGSIKLSNVAGATNVSTINGDVDVDYFGNPPGNSRYYTLNGDINANFKKGLAAQLTFKSFNGDFYSSLDDITPMAVVVEKSNKGTGIAYKVNGNRYKVRQGGPLLDFETFNGDVYLREK